MKSTEKIAVIGGTGKSGKYIVKALIAKGYNLNLLVRNPERFTNPHALINVTIGDVTDYPVLQSLLHGCDAIISTLGMGIPPGSPTIFSEATKNILRAMNEIGVSRYIVTTGLNVDTHLDKKGPVTKLATEWMYANYPKSTKDRQLEYELLSASDILWTLVRLPLIDQTDVQEEISVSLEDCPGEKISAKSLAYFLIEQIDGVGFLKKAPFIANIKPRF
jgi:putative NADH-flavin reductase